MTADEMNFDGREWNTLGERGELLTNEGWRYTRRGAVRHLTRTNLFDSNARSSHCGIGADHSWWFGTGSQEEYERIASLPKCLTCMELVRDHDETPCPAIDRARDLLAVLDTAPADETGGA